MGGDTVNYFSNKSYMAVVKHLTIKLIQLEDFIQSRQKNKFMSIMDAICPIVLSIIAPMKARKDFGQ